MDQGSKEMLKKILAKEMIDISDEDKGFLKARRSYLTASEVEKYRDILEVEEEAKPVAKTKKK